jgi:hypothetical protein
MTHTCRSRSETTTRSPGAFAAALRARSHARLSAADLNGTTEVSFISFRFGIWTRPSVSCALPGLVRHMIARHAARPAAPGDATGRRPAWFIES